MRRVGSKSSIKITVKSSISTNYTEITANEMRRKEKEVAAFPPFFFLLNQFKSVKNTLTIKLIK